MFQSFETDTVNYTAYPPTWALQSGSSMSIMVTFYPSDIGDFPDTLRVQHFGYLGSGEVTFPLTGHGIIVPPSNLTANFADNSVTLNWLPPDFAPDELRFGNGEPFSSIGTSEGVYEFTKRFTPENLIPYSGRELERIAFYTHESNLGDFSLKIYSGSEAENTLLDFPITNIQANSWNEIQLPFPIAIDEVDYLWIGYQIDQELFGFVAGVDGGYGVSGSGDLLRINNNMWTTLGEYGYSNNWNIIGILSDGTNSTFKNQNQKSINSLELIGFNEYRNDSKLNEDPIEDFFYSDEIENNEVYEYGVTAVYENFESLPTSIIVTLPIIFSIPDQWEFNKTSIAHNIQIPAEILQTDIDLMPGDLIGVFYYDNGVYKAAGIAEWNGNSTLLTAYGNDPRTSEKDGFNINESIKWKVFLSSSQSSYTVTADYSEELPHHNGNFQMMGLSMLKSLKLNNILSAENGQSLNKTISLYPNPSNGNVSLSLLNSNDIITVYNIKGTVVKKLIAENSIEQFSIQKQGLYIVEIKGTQETIIKKLIIR